MRLGTIINIKKRRSWVVVVFRVSSVVFRSFSSILVSFFKSYPSSGFCLVDSGKNLTFKYKFSQKNHYILLMSLFKKLQIS